jgi:hypothetical protein
MVNNKEHAKQGKIWNLEDRHDITEILLKVALNTITLTPNRNFHVIKYNAKEVALNFNGTDD